MKLERSNVNFSIWRKKVDKSLFENNGTTVPEWACCMWCLDKLYRLVTSRRDLVKRLTQPHTSIPNWNDFRYSVLPADLASYRLALERMLIRDFASALNNKRDILWYDIAHCALANDKVDL